MRLRCCQQGFFQSNSRFVGLVSSGLLLLSWLFIIGVIRGGARPAELPAVDAELGPCTVDFTVLDEAQKPLYNAKVRVRIKYGFLGFRRMELEVGTNGDGKARVEGLPSKVRKSPLEFTVLHGDRAQTLMHYPAADCNARFKVVLEGR